METHKETTKEVYKKGADSHIKKGSSYEKLLLVMLSLCAILLPVFFIPVASIGFFYAKFGLVTLTAILSIIVFILQVLSERSVERYSLFLTSTFFAVPLVYFISALCSGHPGLSLIGNGTDLDTAFTVFVGSALMYLTSKVFRPKKSVLILSLSLICVSSVLFLFHILRFFFGVDFLSFGIFTTISSNAVGGFNELGIYAGLITIISVLGLELLTPEKTLKFSLYTSLVLSLIVVAVTNFSIVNSLFGLSLSLSLVLAIFALIVFIHKKVANPKSGLPLASLVTLLVTLVFTIATGPIATFVAPAIGLTQQQVLDVRVSPSATVELAGNTYGEGILPALLGTGPNKFYTAWAKYKPVTGNDSVNSTDFWNVDFNLASGYIPTAFVTSGILGGIAWILFLIVLLYYVAKLLKFSARSEKDQLAVYVTWIVSIGTVYLWLMATLFTVGPVLLFSAFMFSGLLIGTLVREDIIKVKVITWDVTKYWKGFALTFSMILLIIACMYLGYVWQKRLVASIDVQDAAMVIQKNNQDITTAQGLLLKSINMYYDTTTLRLASDVSLIRPTALITQVGGVVPQDKLTQDVVSDINFSISTARRAAIDLGISGDYRDWLQLGKAYETATFLGATTTAPLAVQSYLQAEALNPTSPVPPYLIGRLYALARSYDVAAQKLQKAVDLKPDYTEAVDLLKSVNDARAGISQTQTIDTTSSSTKSVSATKVVSPIPGATQSKNKAVAPTPVKK